MENCMHQFSILILLDMPSLQGIWIKPPDIFIGGLDDLVHMRRFTWPQLQLIYQNLVWEQEHTQNEHK